MPPGAGPSDLQDGPRDRISERVFFTDREKIDKSLKYSFLDGIFAMSMMGFTQEYFAPFCLALGATARQIGILNALPNLFSSLAQLKSADLVERIKSRRNVINSFVFLQALMLLPMTATAILGNISVSAFIALVVMFQAFGAIALPPWSSLMADLVHETRRGEYFGWRNKMLGFVMVLAILLAGLILQIMKRFNLFYGFVIVFALAFLFRIASWYFLTKMHEPHLAHGDGDNFTLIDFLSRARKSNFAKFVIFVSAMNFCVNLASPFFAVLMIRDMHFSYMLYSTITMTATLTIYLMMGRWGKLADKIGNLKIIKFTAPIIAILPFLWVINRHPLYLILAQVVSGFAWAGFNLCASNFIFDSVTPSKRTRCVAYFNSLNGLALGAGALIGGFLIPILPPTFGYKILTICLISSALRITVGVFMPTKLKEVRPVTKIGNVELLVSMIRSTETLPRT